MLEFNSFISEELALAPEHPLEQNLERSLPDIRLASPEEIRAIQRRDRIPGIVRRLIPLNSTTVWEYWWCVPGRMLLPEDVEIITSDRQRVETILAKLIWLLGGHCFGENSCLYGDAESVHDWQQVLEFARNMGMSTEVMDIDFMPTAIAQVNLSHPYDQLPVPIAERKTPNYVVVEPGHWHIEFFPLQPIEGGFELVEPKPMCSCQIWTGKPLIKNLETGETTIRYDLGLATPFDITSHPWLSFGQEEGEVKIPLGVGERD